MAPLKPIARQRLVAPQVRSEKAADRLLVRMRAAGSDKVLPRAIWLTAARLPNVLATENGYRV